MMQQKWKKWKKWQHLPGIRRFLRHYRTVLVQGADPPTKKVYGRFLRYMGVPPGRRQLNAYSRETVRVPRLSDVAVHKQVKISALSAVPPRFVF